MRWVHQGLNAQYAQAVQFKTALGIVNAGRIVVFGDEANEAKLLIVTSDNERVLAAAWSSRHRPQAVIVAHASGRVQIFANKRMGLRLNALAAAVRIAEAAKRGITLDLSTEMLEREGSVVGAEVWHYFLAGEMLFNGSLTAPRTEATLLSIEELIELFQQHVQPPSPIEEIPAT